MMADCNGLGILGCIFGGVTIAVAVVAFMIVIAHVDGSLALDALPHHIAASR